MNILISFLFVLALGSYAGAQEVESQAYKTQPVVMIVLKPGETLTGKCLEIENEGNLPSFMKDANECGLRVAENHFGLVGEEALEAATKIPAGTAVMFPHRTFEQFKAAHDAKIYALGQELQLVRSEAAGELSRAQKLEILIAAKDKIAREKAAVATKLTEEANRKLSAVSKELKTITKTSEMKLKAAREEVAMAKAEPAKRIARLKIEDASVGTGYWAMPSQDEVFYPALAIAIVFSIWLLQACFYRVKDRPVRRALRAAEGKLELERTKLAKLQKDFDAKTAEYERFQMVYQTMYGQQKRAVEAVEKAMIWKPGSKVVYMLGEGDQAQKFEFPVVGSGVNDGTNEPFVLLESVFPIPTREFRYYPDRAKEQRDDGLKAHIIKHSKATSESNVSAELH